MARLRAGKQHLKELLVADDWENRLEEIASGGMANVAPLFSFLLLEPWLMHRAARALGMTVAKIGESEPERARNIIRRFMWHLNEESGNIGWGIPDAFAESLVASPFLARDYGRVLLTYIMDLGHDDNYCDNDILRRSCYWAIGRLAERWPDIAGKSRPWLRKGLEDRDDICRGMAAWALGRLKPDIMDGPALNRLAASRDATVCEVFEDGQMQARTVADLAKEALAQ